MIPVTLHRGDCLEVMAAMAPDSFDAAVTDPPYHLTSIVKRFGGDAAAEAQHGTDGLYHRSSRGFMGKAWDGGDIAFRPETWAAVMRVVKPGGYLVAFNHSRTWHRMAAAIEDAGWEIRDSVLDLYDSGPQWENLLDSLTPDQMRALNRAISASDSPLMAWLYGTGFPKSHDVSKGIDKALGSEREVTREGSCIAGGYGGDWDVGSSETRERRDSPATPEAAEWAGWGTALKPAFEPILLARKPLRESSVARQHLATGTGGLNIDAARIGGGAELIINGYRCGDANTVTIASRDDFAPRVTKDGRWPANVVTDGSREVLARFPVDAEGSVARFFYSAKADAADRDGSDHPTVKPQALMRWLVRLVSARGARVLDPFGGSGSTGWAAVAEGRACDLIERDPGYADHIAAKIARLSCAPEATPEAVAGNPQGSLF